ncbi:MAG: two-component system response regulator, partial [Armatimonadota bacterium]|nr:two-component system response regulator [Armatimonadota bacterium]
IPMPARIFSVADTLDAITSNRPYRAAQSFQKAVHEIQDCSGVQFDPDIVKAFLKFNEGDWNQIRNQADVDGWKYLEAAFSPRSAAQLLNLVCP